MTRDIREYRAIGFGLRGDYRERGGFRTVAAARAEIETWDRGVFQRFQIVGIKRATGEYVTIADSDDKRS